MPRFAIILVGTILALAVVGGSAFLFRGCYTHVTAPDADLKKREAEYQKKIDQLMKDNEQLEQDMTAAKKQSAAAYQRAQANARVADSWRSKYVKASAEREALKRAPTGSAAVGELKKMGWVR